MSEDILEKSLMYVTPVGRHLQSLVHLSLIHENTQVKNHTYVVFVGKVLFPQESSTNTFDPIQEKDHLSANYVEILIQILKI
jgi:hypothetical protein